MGFFKAVGTGFRLAGFTARVVTGAATAGVRSAVGLAGTTHKAIQKVNNRDWDGLEKLAETSLNAAERSFVAKANAVEHLINEAERSYNNPKHRFLTKENADRAASIALLAGGAIAGGSLLDVDLDFDDADASGGFTDMTDVTPGAWASGIPIDNGVFAGDGDDLAELIERGQIEDANHVASEDITRDLGARDAFLRAHGFEGVPEGYEVHHVVPLSAGGADDPSNMILLSEEDHNTITAAHSRFYGWHA